MKIGACYIRVSTDDQLEYSPDSQLKELQRFAKANDITLSEDYIFTEDEGRSGRSVKRRPEFQRMINTAKQNPKPFDVILVWKFSRFARNREDAVVYKSMLRKQHDIDVVSVSENIGDDKMSVLVEAIIEAMDEWYSINLGEEVIRGMEERFSRGEAVSLAPFGYQMENKKLVPHPEQAPIIQQLFADYLQGIGLKPLANMLNQLGIRTNRGNLFENRTVRYILTNPVYVGKLRWSAGGRTNFRIEIENDSNIVQGVHEGIISPEVFQAVQERLQDTAKRYKRYGRQNSHHMLQGVLRCSNCGATMVTSKDGLQCHSYAKGKCSQSHYINLKKAEAFVLQYLTEMDALESFTVLPPTAPKKAVDNSQMVARERQKLMRIQSAYEDGIDTLAEYKEKKSKILNRIEELTQVTEQEPEPVTVRQVLEAHADDIKRLQNPTISGAEKNSILRGFVSHIVFERTSGLMRFFVQL